MFSASFRRLFCAAILLAPVVAAAQQQPTAAATPLPATSPARPLANVVRLNPLFALTGVLGDSKALALAAGYERQLASHFGGAAEVVALADGTGNSYYGLYLQGRFYVVPAKHQRALCGLYVAPHLGFKEYQVATYDGPATWQAMGGLGGQVGVQTSLSQHWRFDASLGLTRWVSGESRKSNTFSPDLSMLPELRLNIGYAF